MRTTTHINKHDRRPTSSQFRRPQQTLSPDHVARVAAKLGLAPVTVEPDIADLFVLESDLTALEVDPYRQIGFSIAAAGLAASGVLDRCNDEEVESLVGFFEELAVLTGSLGYQPSLELLLSDSVRDWIGDSVGPTTEALFVEIIAVLDAARFTCGFHRSGGNS